MHVLRCTSGIWSLGWGRRPARASSQTERPGKRPSSRMTLISLAFFRVSALSSVLQACSPQSSQNAMWSTQCDTTFLIPTHAIRQAKQRSALNLNREPTQLSYLFHGHDVLIMCPPTHYTPASECIVSHAVLTTIVFVHHFHKTRYWKGDLQSNLIHRSDQQGLYEFE